MSSYLFQSYIDHEVTTKNTDKVDIEDKVLDNILDIKLTHESSSNIGGQASIKLAYMNIPFTRVVLNSSEELEVKGPLGRTVLRVDVDTDVGNSIKEFAENESDIEYIESELREGA